LPNNVTKANDAMVTAIVIAHTALTTMRARIVRRTAQPPSGSSR
jgi:hypothetical protein